MTLRGMRWRGIEMEGEPIEVKSNWSEMCGMKSWESSRVAKYVE
jgi:hypothetical protein